MKFKILALVLVAFFLLFAAGCAKKGETGTAGGTTGGASGGAGTASGGTATGGTGTTSGSGTSAAETTDVGNLFKIDTDKPEEGSGYNVPAPTG